MLTTIRYFRDEYDAHIRDRKCPAKQCKPLLTYSINEESCKGCSLCSRKCPANAISGEPKKPFKIDPAVCIRCGACAAACRFGAVSVD